MRRNQAVGVSVLLLAGLLLTGCGARAEPASTPSADPTQAEAPEDGVALDAAACDAVSEVLTIVDNANVALREGRMAAQEQQGWYEVATRVLDRIPSSDDRAVSQSIAELKLAVPAVPAGTWSEPIDFTSAAWRSAFSPLRELCVAADAELTIQAFTGG